MESCRKPWSHVRLFRVSESLLALVDYLEKRWCKCRLASVRLMPHLFRNDTRDMCIAICTRARHVKQLVRCPIPRWVAVITGLIMMSIITREQHAVEGSGMDRREKQKDLSMGKHYVALKLPGRRHDPRRWRGVAVSHFVLISKIIYLCLSCDRDAEDTAVC